MLTFISLLGLVLKRLRQNLGLNASAIVGIVAILTIAVCVPIFSEAVSGEVLHRQLISIKKDTSRQLFSLRFVYQEKGIQSLIDLEKSQAITGYIINQFERMMDLPVDQVVMDIRAGSLTVTDLNNRWPEAQHAPLGSWSFVVQELLPSHARIIEGRWPKPDDGKSGGPVQVAIPLSTADKMMVKIGDRFLLDPLEVVVTGFYEVNDTRDPIWFNNPDSEYSGTAWIPLETYQARIRTVVQQPVGEVTWYVIVADKNIQFERAGQYLVGLTRINADLSKTVEGIQNTYTPMEALVAYQKRADALATLFYVVGSPMIVLALIFIGLTARISVQQIENETAILRARGTSRGEVLFLNLAESLVLFIFAIPLALLSGWLAANLMNQTVSFLQFTNRSIFTISYSGLNYLILAGSIVVIFLARFFPIISASRTTVMRVKHEQSRGAMRPFWERFYLDFFLLIPGIYAFFVLKGWSEPAQFLTQLQLTSDQQFRDPLLFIAPALFAIALSLVVVRLIPFLVRLLAAIANRLPGVWAYLSLQQIARRSQDHSSALLLIIIALSLSIFTVSAARTLDRWLYDSEYYKVGADLALQEFLSLATNSGSGGPDSSSSSNQVIESFLTIEEHNALPGVTAATRIGKYDCKVSYGRGEVPCLVIGIDRLDFPKVAYFREDFSTEDLGTLMNELGQNLQGAIAPAALMLKNGIVIGDQFSLTVTVGSATYSRDFTVVGTYDYFPTVFPKDRPTIIVNLESIFNYPDDVEGYQVLLNLKPDAYIPDVIRSIQDQIGIGRAVVKVNGDAADALIAGQDKPERMGLFGIMNVGFLATGLMPGIGFLIYSYASLRQRFIQLGILQAIGLSVRQLIASLVSEQMILMGLALLAGASIGLATSVMFVPSLQTGATPGAPIPPFWVVIGWAEAGWLSLGFGLVLSLTMLGTIIYLARLKVFQAVKLGETL